MPNLDTTGPDGVGPTGRGRGKCARAVAQNQGLRGRGRGLGFGLGRGMCPYVLRDDLDDTVLEEEEMFLSERLAVVKKARAKLKKEK